MSGNCAMCGQTASMCCSACKSIKYCSVEHQHKHWKIHKPDCRPFSISQADDVGRFLLATRDIQRNSVIFTELPIVVGAKWFLTEREVTHPIVPCVGCYIPVHVGKAGCPKCGWPVCSEICAGINNPKLHGLECPILMLGSGPEDRTNLKSMLDYYREDALVVLKCLMLQRQFPKKWKQLLDMQSHEKERINSELYEDAENRIVSFLQDNFLKRLKCLERESNKTLLAECDATILHKICGIIETNYMCINLMTGLELTGIFYTACMMEHSCIPNCYFSFDHSNGFQISVMAGRDIKKGEHFQISYSNMLWGTQMRQEHLELTKHFLCKCNRCRDPTELGTYLSALICIGTDLAPCGGVQLPENPLQQNTDWKCNKCSVKISSNEVRYLMTQMGEEVDALLSKKPSIRQLESLIDKLSQFLYKNHYHLFNLRHSLIQLYGTQPGYFPEQLSNELLLKKITICEELLDVSDKLDPYCIRLSLYVGIILSEMQKSVVEHTDRLLVQLTDRTQRSKLYANYEKAEHLLVRALKVLEKDLDTVAGAKLHEAIKKSLIEVRHTIATKTK